MEDIDQSVNLSIYLSIYLSMTNLSDMMYGIGREETYRGMVMCHKQMSAVDGCHYIAANGEEACHSRLLHSFPLGLGAAVRRG